MSEHTPKFLAVHFDGDYLEHAAFVNSEEEASQLTCLVSPGDHWSPVLIPIETAAAAPYMLTALQMIVAVADDDPSASPAEIVTAIDWDMIEKALAKAM